MLSRLAEVDGALAAVGPELVPERIPGHQLERVMGLLARIERRVGGARLVLARAAADAGGWRAAGARSPEEHLARQAGSSLGEARADLRASGQLAGLGSARDAAASGALSKAKARAVADGASADPGAERSLVDTARTGDLAATRDAARRVRSRVEERDGRKAQRMYRRRALRPWVELDGEGRGTWNVPPGFHAVWLAALEPYRQEAFHLARQAGRRVSSEALMADAMQLLCLDVLADANADLPPDTIDPAESGAADATDGDRAGPAGADRTGGPSGQPDPPRARPAPTRRRRKRRRGGGNRRAPAQVIVHVDLTALRRGHADDGETCEIPGVGPIPVSLARQLAADATLRLVLRDGADVTTITSHRRYVPAPLRAALDARDPTCVVPGCTARHHLQIHHWRTDHAAGGPTELANLARLCRPHHDLVTHAGWTLTGGPGHWRYEPPP